MNIEEIAAVYIAEKRRVRRESTVEGYESALRLHVLPRWGACGIDEIGTAYEHYIVPRKSVCVQAQRTWSAHLQRAA